MLLSPHPRYKDTQTRRGYGTAPGFQAQLSGPRGHAYPLQGLPSPGIADLGLTLYWAPAEQVHPRFPFILTAPRRLIRLTALSRAPQMLRAESRAPPNPQEPAHHQAAASGLRPVPVDCFIGAQSVTPAPLPSVLCCF